MVAAARPGMATVEHEFVGAEPDLAGVLVNASRDGDGVVPTGGGLNVDLDHAGVRRDLDDVEARIVGRPVTLDMDRHADFARSPFHRGQQIQKILEPVERRQEDA